MTPERAVFPVWFRRLLAAPLTLFGVALLCFVLLDLATDERVLVERVSDDRTSAGIGSDAVADRLVAQRFLHRRHLPALWNGNVLDREGFAARELDELERGVREFGSGSGGRYAQARAALRLQGWSAVLPIARRLEREDLDPRFRDVLLELLVDRGALDRPSLEAFHLSKPHWRARQERAVLEAEVRAFARGDARAASTFQEQRLLPYLWKAIEERSPGLERDRLLRVFDALRSRGGIVRGELGGPVPDEARLRAWWRTHHLLHEDLTEKERRLAAWTETRFALWFRSLMAFDLGVDSRGLPVGPELLRRLRITLPLMAIALVLSFALAIPFGVLAARPGRDLRRRVADLISTGLYCTPRFCLAVVVLMLFAEPGPLGFLPPTWSAEEGSLLRRAALPLIVLTLPALIYVTRFVRAGVREVLAQDYVRTARANGIGETRIYFRHALTNAWSPIVTLVGDVLPALVGGSVIVELVFDVPGMGRYIIEALTRRDAQALMGVTLVSAVVTLLGLWSIELFHAVADPRRRRAS